MPRYLSKEKLEELKKELAKFKTAKRIEVAERLKRAKEFGDLSENSEYAEAREEQENVELRISELEEIIKNAVIFKKGKGRATVGIGSTVEVKKNNETKKFVIVGSDEARPEQGLISNESPLGAMLIGKKQGDVFSLTTRAGEIRYKIVRIE
jgi:transcription elongation factor GreA